MTDTTRDTLQIRAVEPDDYECLREIYSQRNAYYYTLGMPFQSADFWRKRLATPSHDGRSLLAEIDGRPVGSIGLFVERNPRRRHVANIGMGVHDEFVGRGIGESLVLAALDLADNWLNIQRVELTVFVDNERAIRLYERTGFQAEGTHRAYAFRDGDMVDVISMARLRAD